LRKGLIKITAVENDKQPRSLVILTGLKTLFQKQLPKMPREYIARLVYDTNSKCLAIIKRGLKVVGGICYRPFPHRGFAEIVFFATASVDQVKVSGALDSCLFYFIFTYHATRRATAQCSWTTSKPTFAQRIPT
jgi:histone acetyltransferase